MKDAKKEILSLQVQSFECLGTNELLALVLRTGGIQTGTPMEQANRLLSHFGSLHQMRRAGLEEIKEMGQLDEEKAASVLAATFLAQQCKKEAIYRGKRFFCSKQIFDYFQDSLGLLEREELWVVLLDHKNGMLKVLKIAQGSGSRCIFSVQELFAPVLREKANKMILVHNHPSGDCKPSLEDFEITERIQSISDLLDVKLLDHLIVSRDNYYSFADHGEINPDSATKITRFSRMLADEKR